MHFKLNTELWSIGIPSLTEWVIDYVYCMCISYWIFSDYKCSSYWIPYSPIINAVHTESHILRLYMQFILNPIFSDYICTMQFIYWIPYSLIINAVHTESHILRLYMQFILNPIFSGYICSSYWIPYCPIIYAVHTESHILRLYMQFILTIIDIPSLAEWIILDVIREFFNRAVHSESSQLFPVRTEGFSFCTVCIICLCTENLKNHHWYSILVLYSITSVVTRYQ